jgi:hypothetical protein
LVAPSWEPLGLYTLCSANRINPLDSMPLALASRPAFDGRYLNLS